MNQRSDNELLKQFKQGDNSSYAFNLLVRKYQERLYWHIRRIVFQHEDADDVLQNTFIKVYQNLHKFREESNLYTWLYRIATNEALLCIKKRNKINFLALDDVTELQNSSAETGFSGDEIQYRLQKAIHSLPEKQRVVFLLRYHDEMKYEDMAEVLQTSVGSLKASYHHAVKKVEKFLTGD